MFCVRLYPHNEGWDEPFFFTTEDAARAFCDRINALPERDREYLSGIDPETDDAEVGYFAVQPYQSTEAAWEDLTGYYTIEEEDDDA